MYMVVLVQKTITVCSDEGEGGAVMLLSDENDDYNDSVTHITAPYRHIVPF